MIFVEKEKEKDGDMMIIIAGLAAFCVLAVLVYCQEQQQTQIDRIWRHIDRIYNSIDLTRIK